MASDDSESDESGDQAFEWPLWTSSGWGELGSCCSESEDDSYSRSLSESRGSDRGGLYDNNDGSADRSLDGEEDNVLAVFGGDGRGIGWDDGTAPF